MAEFKNEIKEFWGDHLVTINHEILDQLDLSQVTKTLLSSIGLPVNSEKVKGSPFYLHFYDKPKIKLDDQGDRYLIIGDNEGNELGIHLRTSRLYYIDSCFDRGKRFINVDISKFLMFLKIYLNYQPQMISAMEMDNEERLLGIVEKIKQQFHQVDGKALVDEETYWSVILEQVEDGLSC